MVEAPTNSLTTLYIIHYLAWQREGRYTFDRQRAQLLDTLAKIVADLKTSDQQGVVLGGETILLNDVGTVSHAVLKSLEQHLQRGTLTIGPWYIQLDGLLTSGETFVRSLLLGRLDAKIHNIKLNNIALLPDNYQSSVQLPYILKNFGISEIFVRSSHPMMPLPFNWQADDGSQVLVLPYQTADVVQDAIKQQKKFQPDGPFLWIQQSNASDLTESDLVEFEQANTSLAEFASAVRERLPDQFRPVLTDALYLQPLSYQSGRFSARISFKQALMLLNARLTHHAEALLALSLVFGDLRYPAIQKSLLDYSWRLLLQNMSPRAFAGAVTDDTYDEMLLRNRRVEDNTQQIIEKALTGLSAKLYQDDRVKTETYIAVWNPHGHDEQQLVQLNLDLPKGIYPNVLLSPTDEEKPFTWDNNQQTIDFLADVPALGYAVYTLKVSRDKTADYNQRRAVAGRSIGTVAGESLGLVGGRLDWTFANGNIIDLLTYHDGGDAGDIWQYQKPQLDVVMKGSIVDVIQVEATPTYERLIFRNRMRIAPKLKDGKERVRGLRVLDLNTTATYHNGLKGIHFRTSFTNTAEDHRLRVHLRTGINASEIATDSTFSLVKHPISDNAPVGDLPIQSTILLSDDDHTLAIFTRGLLSVEPIREDNQITLALTLLRAVGMLDKSKGIQSSGAQIPNDIVTEFMVIPLETHPNQAELVRKSLLYTAPLQAFQYSEKPDKTRHSYLKITSDYVVAIAIKPPQSQDGLIIRLRNTHDSPAVATLTAQQIIKEAQELNLAEEMVNPLIPSNNILEITVLAGQLMTILLQF